MLETSVSVRLKGENVGVILPTLMKKTPSRRGASQLGGKARIQTEVRQSGAAVAVTASMTRRFLQSVFSESCIHV